MKDVDDFLYEVLDSHESVIVYIVEDLFQPCLYVNRAAELVTGYTKQELTGKVIPYELIHPKDREIVLENFRRRVKGGDAPSQYTYKVVAKDGMVKWVNVKLSTVKWKGRLAVCGIGMDVTSYVEKQNLLETIFDLMDEGVVVLDGDFSIKMANRSMKNIMRIDLPDREIVGKKCYELVYQKGSPCDGCPTVRALNTGKPSKKLIHVKGKDLWYETKSNPLVDETGYVFGVVEYVRDVTLEKLRERELIRTESLRTLERVAGGIAHDFNNILAVIMGNLSVLKMHIKDPYLKGKLEAAEKACFEARELTHQLMRFSKSTGLSLEQVDISILVGSVVSEVSRGVPCSFSYSGDVEVGEVLVDPAYFKSALQSLLIFLAETLGREKRGEISVVLQETLNHVKIEVVAKGVSLGEDLFREDPGFGATGEILRKMGLGFSVVVRREETAVEIFVPKVSRSQSSVPSGLVLLMGDRTSLADMLRVYLEGKGYEAVSHLSVEDLLDSFNRLRGEGKEIKAVIVDASLGGLDPMRSLIEREKDTKFILITPKVDDVVKKRACDFGFTTVIEKPFSLDELLEVL